MQPSKAWFAGVSNFCLTPFSRTLLQTLKDHLNQHWDLLIAEQFWVTPKTWAYIRLCWCSQCGILLMGQLIQTKLLLQRSRRCTFAPHEGAGLFGLVRGDSVAAMPEEMCRGSGAASPSHMLPGQDTKAPLAGGDATPAPSHPELGGKQGRVTPSTRGCRCRSRTEGELFIALLH